MAQVAADLGVPLEPVDEVIREPLLKVEATNMIMAPGIATITFFRGDAKDATPSSSTSLARWPSPTT